MEVFSVFATLSLADMISSPLDKVKGAMSGLSGNISRLGGSMGRLALAMAPVALGAGLLLGVLGLAAPKAMAFESAMADVAKVVNFETQAEFTAMSDTVKEMAGRIPMAASGIAAIIAAAGQSGVAKQDLAEFAEQAAKMGVAFDLTGDQAGKMMADWRAGMNLSLPKVYALADAVNYLSNNMNAGAPALGEVIQRVGAAAMACGLGETQVAALGAAFLSAGASPEVASTALKKFTTTLVKGAAMSKEQAAAFQGLGFSAKQMAVDMQTNAQGTIFKVLQALANKPKELQMSLLTQMFGEEAIGAIAPLLQNMGNLTQAFELVGDASNYAGSMQAEFDTRSKTTANALQLLSNKLTNLAISVGNIFLPAIGTGAELLGGFADAVRYVVDTPLGQWIVGAAGGLATALILITAFAAATWFLSGAMPLLAKAIAPVKAALLGMGAPFWVLIAVAGLLYAAYRTNFGGMADTLDSWWNKATLVVKGVMAVFATMQHGMGILEGELLEQLEAAGLVPLVTTIAKVVRRIKELLGGMAQGFQDVFAEAWAAVEPFARFMLDTAMSAVRWLSSLGGAAAEAGAAWTIPAWQNVGTMLGRLAAVLLTVKAAMLVVRGAQMAWTAVMGISRAAMLVWQGVLWGVRAVTMAFTAAQWLLNAAFIANPIGLVILAIAALAVAVIALVENWDTISAWWAGIWQGIKEYIASFSIVTELQGMWNSITGYLTSLDLFSAGSALLTTFMNGILSTAGGLYESLKSALGPLGSLLPHSDADEGPLSALTQSGTALVATLGEGVSAGSGGLKASFSQALHEVNTVLQGGVSPLPALTGGDIAPPNMPDAPNASPQDSTAPVNSTARAGKQNITIHIGSITLPEVTDAKSFVEALQNMISEYEGATV